jgi:hypothetical protein
MIDPATMEALVLAAEDLLTWHSEAEHAAGRCNGCRTCRQTLPALQRSMSGAPVRSPAFAVLRQAPEAVRRLAVAA